MSVPLASVSLMTSIDEAIATARAQAPAPAPVETLIVRPERDTPLEALLCLYEAYKAEHDAAEAKWSEYKTALTSALRAYNPDENIKVYEVPGRSVTSIGGELRQMWPGISVAWRDGREYLPTDLIRKHIPQVWDAFKKRSKGYWDIRLKGK